MKYLRSTTLALLGLLCSQLQAEQTRADFGTSNSPDIYTANVDPESGALTPKQSDIPFDRGAICVEFLQ
jgi:hypothetical protein